MQKKEKYFVQVNEILLGNAVKLLCSRVGKLYYAAKEMHTAQKKIKLCGAEHGQGYVLERKTLWKETKSWWESRENCTVLEKGKNTVHGKGKK